MFLAMLLPPLNSFQTAPQPMHIPDGFLSVPVAIALWIIAIVVVGYALRKTNKTLGERQVPLMGVLAAAIFAGQMLNFSVTGGTSGHLLGAAVATILLGPWPALLVLTSVVGVQAILFQDGGILALGANICNMAIVGVLVSYALYTFLFNFFKKQSWGLFVSGFVAAWASILIASLACAIELVLSGTSPVNIAIPAMGAIHALIGIGEGLITAAALTFVFATRKDLLKLGEARPANNKAILVVGGLIALVLAVLAPLASTNPDGLEWVAEQHGFLESAQSALFNLIPDYAMPGVSDPALATIVAGIVGVVIVFGVAYGAARAGKTSPAEERVRG